MLSERSDSELSKVLCVFQTLLPKSRILRIQKEAPKHCTTLQMEKEIPILEFQVEHQEYSSGIIGRLELSKIRTPYLWRILKIFLKFHESISSLGERAEELLVRGSSEKK